MWTRETKLDKFDGKQSIYLILLRKLEGVIDACVVKQHVMIGQRCDAVANTADVLAVVQSNRLQTSRASSTFCELFELARRCTYLEIWSEPAVFSAALVNRGRRDPDEAVSSEDD